MREQNERGCYLVKVSEKKKVSIQFLPLDSVRWFSVTVRIETIESINQLDLAISGEIEEVREKADSRPIICRVTLTGRGPLYKELQRENAVLDLLERTRENHLSETPFVWVQQVQLDCRPEVDLTERRKGEDFLGQILRISGKIGCSEMQTNEAILSVLSDMFNNRRVEKAIGSPSEQELKKMLDDAELICVDRLEDSD
jgi:hypothetical protein